MKIESTELEGVYVIENFNAADERGLFVKTFNSNSFKESHLDFKIRESYYSVSKKNVIRGMHFQLPPFDHEKLVYVPVGAIQDVVVDLRKDSPTYKNFLSVELSATNKKSIYIPKGLAHGFKSLKKNTITVYNVSTEYDKPSDKGIHYNSFGFNWDVKVPLASKRDIEFEDLNSFIKSNPF